MCFMNKEPTRCLARIKGVDLVVEDHGILMVSGTFEYENGGAQGLGGYCIDTSFLYRLFACFGVERLREINGKSCWVTHTHNGILKIEPLHKQDGQAFDIGEWQEFVEKLKLPSPHEMRTGENPEHEDSHLRGER